MYFCGEIIPFKTGQGCSERTVVIWGCTSLKHYTDGRNLASPPGHCVTLSLWPFPAGGAGGKGVWGRSGEVYEPEEVDKKDPNYDDAQVSLVWIWNIERIYCEEPEAGICNRGDALTGKLRV